jgi:Mrp family chromosome partitioning ATPase
LADAPLLANLASGTLLVVEAGTTRITVARNALRRLQLTRARIIGAALTKFQSPNTGYGYGYADYYSYGASRHRKLAAR